MLSQLKAYSVEESTWDSDWDKIQQDCNFLTDWGKHTLSNELKDSVKSVVLEPHYICKDHRNLYSNYYSKKFKPNSPYVSRLHFFSCSGVEIPKLLLEPESYSPSYIGYSVIRPVVDRCIGRTIINPIKLKKFTNKKLYCLRTTFPVHVGGNHFHVDGYPYISQDSDVTVCAHSAMWGVCRYLSERYPLYGELYPFDLINLTETSSGRVFPYRRMNYSDYSSILSAFGCYPEILLMKQDREAKDYFKGAFETLYSYIESGFPILASFQGHVVEVIGHTINYRKRPRPDGNNLIDSSKFVKQLVVIDDNFFPYQLLGNENDPENYGNIYREPKYNINSIVAAVCPLPEKVFMPAEIARKKSLKYIEWLKPKLVSTGNGPFVTRLFITTNTAFKRHCIQRSQIGGKIDRWSAFVTNLFLPHFIWVMEVSPVDQYKKGFCTAELVIDPTCNETEESAIYMRIGKSIIYDKKMYTDANSLDKFPQYTHNLGDKKERRK